MLGERAAVCAASALALSPNALWQRRRGREWLNELPGRQWCWRNYCKPQQARQGCFRAQLPTWQPVEFRSRQQRAAAAGGAPERRRRPQPRVRVRGPLHHPPHTRPQPSLLLQAPSLNCHCRGKHRATSCTAGRRLKQCSVPSFPPTSQLLAHWPRCTLPNRHQALSHLSN